MKNCKRIETQLPEAMIQHIQSFMSGKEAARTTLLSHSWRSAWLTRPTLVFDQRDFKNPHQHELAEVATKAIQRYKALNMKIESFTLQSQNSRMGINHVAEKLILGAMEIGATELNLEFRPSTVLLPPEVLRSQTLSRLSVKGCKIDGSVSCPNLKSLRLDRVRLRNDGMIFHKLRRLYLEFMEVDNSFFNDSDSRFPCLKDMTLVRCHGHTALKLASTSLERISIVPSKMFEAELRVPNLAYFSYSGVRVPSVSIEGAREWESHISIKCRRSYACSCSWYLRLHKLLMQLRSSRITLSLNVLVRPSRCALYLEHFGVVDEPVVVENLIIEASFNFGLDLLISWLWICHPKLVTLYWLPKSCKNWNGNSEAVREIWETLTMEAAASDCGISGRFGLKKVNVDIYEEILGEWRPLLAHGELDALTAPPNKRKVCFRLQW